MLQCITLHWLFWPSTQYNFALKKCLVIPKLTTIDIKETLENVNLNLKQLTKLGNISSFGGIWLHRNTIDVDSIVKRHVVSSPKETGKQKLGSRAYNPIWRHFRFCLPRNWTLCSSFAYISCPDERKSLNWEPIMLFLCIADKVFAPVWCCTAN